jgi:tungstate transport system ATP-binding protein
VTASIAQEPPLISLRGIRVQRGARTILDVPSLEIWPETVTAVIGRNGAGKSTLLQTMALLLTPDEGEVHFRGAPVSPRRNAVSVRRRMAVVFQDPLLFDTTVYGNVASGLQLRGAPRASVQTRVDVWLRRLRIEHLATRPSRTLSGGEARRASLARALVLEPELLLLDEPFAALDYYTRGEFLAELPGLLKEARTTTVVVTHDPGEAEQLGQRAIALDQGRIVADGPVREVLVRAGLVPATAGLSAPALR